MKLLRLFSKQEFVLTDEQASQVRSALLSGSKGFIDLHGSVINTSGVESLGDVPQVGYAHGQYPLLSDGNSYMRDGHRVYLHDRNHVVMKIHPRYAVAGPLQLTDGKD